MSLRWHDRAFDELTARELHGIYSLRVRVFIVEQTCVYQGARRSGVDSGANSRQLLGLLLSGLSGMQTMSGPYSGRREPTRARVA